MLVEFVFTILGGILIIGLLSEILFKYAGIPDVLIMILIGIFIKEALHVNPLDFGPITEIFATFALIYILFQGSLNIRFRTLLQSARSTATLTILSFVFTVVAVTAVMIMSGMDTLTAALTGMILGGVSGTVVIPLVSRLNLGPQYRSALTIESATSDVLCIIGTLTILQIMQTGNIAASHIFRSVLSTFSLGIVVGAVVGIIWVYLLNRFKTLAEEYMVTVGVVMLLYALVQSSLVAASGAIACLTFGVVIGNSKSLLVHFNKDDESKPIFNAQALDFFKEISFFLKVIFFVYLGMLVNFGDWSILLIGLLITGIMFLVRPLVVKLSFKNIEDQNRTLLEVLIPKGLAAAVLAQFAAPQLSTDVSLIVGNVVLSVVFFSIIATSILVFLTQKEWFKGFFHRNSTK